MKAPQLLTFRDRLGRRRVALEHTDGTRVIFRARDTGHVVAVYLAGIRHGQQNPNRTIRLLTEEEPKK